ncbi:hypothetical protein G3I59_40180 [Amycolatopsis rubida]|uniref:YceI family protein n=1 Tax=Amycolatopsis rubida TaxID=112413 RepID=A0ABX0C1V2_9PSEU|nr:MULTISPECIES: hypothetical protein [Amycolatopsis]MYW96666.1 hypothetical protein [Amycolatopsis rubida]NEC61651.1 hypothetical protein [Amycolatopsis rubida]OAP24751.1 hypothetical protein A4R44_04264 [Amycolatopsis sp. M39]
MPISRIARTGVLAAAAATAVSLASAVPAAATEIPIPISYSVTGSTVVKKTGSTLDLGPGSLAGNLLVDDQTGAVGLNANLQLPPATAHISMLAGGFKIKAKVTVTPTAPATGTLANGTLTTHETANMEISDIWAGPIVPVFPVPTVPGSCTTVKPIDLTLTAANVDITKPITLAGNYTIPDFKNCFIADLALGALVSGPDNTISLTLTAKN